MFAFFPDSVYTAVEKVSRFRIL